MSPVHPEKDHDHCKNDQSFDLLDCFVVQLHFCSFAEHAV